MRLAQAATDSSVKPRQRSRNAMHNRPMRSSEAPRTPLARDNPSCLRCQHSDAERRSGGCGNFLENLGFESAALCIGQFAVSPMASRDRAVASRCKSRLLAVSARRCRYVAARPSPAELEMMR